MILVLLRLTWVFPISTDTTPLVDGVTGAIVGVHNKSEHLKFWCNELNYEIVAEGVISSRVASEIYAVNGEIKVTSLAPAKADSGQVWLFQTENSASLIGTHPHTSQIGLHALDLYTRDALATHAQITRAGWEWAATPEAYEVPIGEKSIEITEGFCYGPEGTDVVFVEAKTVRPTIAWDRNPELPYCELTSVVCGVQDMEKAKAFFGPEGLGLGIWYDVTLSSPGIEKMAHLPPGTLVQLAFLAGSKTARVEIINTSNLPDRLNITAKQRVGLSLGHSGWSFITHDIETACKKITLQGGKVISNMIQTDDPVHGKARIVSALTPEGSFIELWESN